MNVMVQLNQESEEQFASDQDEKHFKNILKEIDKSMLKNGEVSWQHFTPHLKIQSA